MKNSKIFKLSIVIIIGILFIILCVSYFTFCSNKNNNKYIDKPVETTVVQQTLLPTEKPTATPTVEPTIEPTVEPTATPSPTPTPTPKPTEVPTPEPKYITVVATAYCKCQKCCGKYALNRPVDENGKEIVYTALGAIAKSKHTIATDPTVIPWGTRLKIGEIIYTAEDSGKSIKGNKIDIYFDTHRETEEFGIRTLTAEILD